MGKRRGYIPKDEIIAALIRQHFNIPWETARSLTAKQIASRYHVDHNIFKTWEENPGEFDQHWNLTVREIAVHREKTAKVDVPAIAKSRRISKAHEEFRARILAKTTGEPIRTQGRPKAKIPSRPFAKAKRPMRSRNSFQRVRKGSLSASEGVKR